MCDFPAKQLLEQRRRISERASHMQDDTLISACAEFVLRCDQLRLLHEQITECECWYDALRESKVIA